MCHRLLNRVARLELFRRAALTADARLHRPVGGPTAPKRVALALVITLLTGACAATRPDLAAEVVHPANPDALEAPLPAASTTLSLEPQGAAAGAGSPMPTPGHGLVPGTGAHAEHGSGRAQPAPHDHSAEDQ